MSNRKDDTFYVDIVMEFVEVLIHQVIYLRDVYPASIFVTRRKFNLPLHMSQHPLVNEYITKVVASLKKYLSKPDADVDSVDIVVSASGGHVDRFRLEFGNLAALKSSNSASVRSDQFMVELEMTLASLLLRLAQAIASMSSTQEERDWWVELGTTEQGAMRLMEGEVWCVAESDKGGDIIPVMGVQKPFKMQLYVETRD